MVISGRLIVHAPVRRWGGEDAQRNLMTIRRRREMWQQAGRHLARQIVDKVRDGVGEAHVRGVFDLQRVVERRMLPTAHGDIHTMRHAQSGTAVQLIRVRFHIIRNYQIENVCKSQSCMVSKFICFALHCFVLSPCLVVEGCCVRCER